MWRGGDLKDSGGTKSQRHKQGSIVPTALSSSSSKRDKAAPVDKKREKKGDGGGDESSSSGKKKKKAHDSSDSSSHSSHHDKRHKSTTKEAESVKWRGGDLGHGHEGGEHKHAIASIVPSAISSRKGLDAKREKASVLGVAVDGKESMANKASHSASQSQDRSVSASHDTESSARSGAHGHHKEKSIKWRGGDLETGAVEKSERASALGVAIDGKESMANKASHTASRSHDRSATASHDTESSARSGHHKEEKSVKWRGGEGVSSKQRPASLVPTALLSKKGLAEKRQKASVAGDGKESLANKRKSKKRAGPDGVEYLDSELGADSFSSHDSSD